MFCCDTYQWGIRGPQHWPVSWAPAEPAGQVRVVINSKFATRRGRRSVVLSGWRRNWSGNKESGISNSRPALVCPPGPLSLTPCGHTYQLVDAAGCVFRLSLVLCYWARQACQMSRLWCVERLLTDSLALPCCHSQVSQSPTVCQRRRLQRQWLLPVCVLLVCLTDRLSAMIKLLYLRNVTFVVCSS